MTLLAAMLAAAVAAEPEEVEEAAEPEFAWSVPAQPEAVGSQCPRSLDLVVGQPVPPELLDDRGRVRCYATAVPTSRLAQLLLVEAWAWQAEPRGLRLDLELGWERAERIRLEAQVASLEDPPWLQRPGTQRTLGRVETTVVFLAALGIYMALDGAIDAAPR